MTAFGLYPSPVRKVSRPVLEVSIWPLNSRLFPLPVPSQSPTTFARPSSTSCQDTARPICSSVLRMYRTISNSSPVALGMFTTSQDIATISSSRICARIAVTSSSFIEPCASAACGVIILFSATKIVRIRAKLLTPLRRHQEIVFQAQASATLPVNSRFDGPHHARLHRSRRQLMRIGRLVRPRSDAMSNRMRRLPRISRGINSLPDDAINIAHRRAIVNGSNGIVENRQQLVEECVVSHGEQPRAKILRQVSPIAIRTYPNLNERRLIFNNRPRASGGERRNAWPRPHQSERASHLHFPFVANADRVNMPFDHGRNFALSHSSLDVVAGMLHAQRSEFICQAQTLDFLSRLEHTNLSQKQRRIDRFLASITKRIVKSLPVNGRLAHHAIADLRSLRKLDAHSPRKFSLPQNLNSHFHCANHRRPRIFRMIERKKPDIFIPSGALRLAKLWFDYQQRRLAFARENRKIIALHGPVIREV